MHGAGPCRAGGAAGVSRSEGKVVVVVEANPHMHAWPHMLHVRTYMYMYMAMRRADRQTPSHQYRPVRDGRRQCWCWGHAADPMCVRACMDAVGLSEVSALTKRPCIACMHAAPCPAVTSCLLKAIYIASLATHRQQCSLFLFCAANDSWAQSYIYCYL